MHQASTTGRKPASRPGLGRGLVPKGRRMLLAALTAFAGFGLTVATALPAWAHAALVRSQPVPGGVLEAPPAELRLWFSEPVRPSLARAEVRDGTGRSVAGGGLRNLPGEATGLVLPLAGAGPGSYQVSWSVLSAADAHITRGTFSFAVAEHRPASTPAPEGASTGAGPPLPGGRLPAPSPAAPSGVPGEAYLRWLVFLLAAWLLGGAVFTRVVVPDVPLPRRLVVGPALVLLAAMIAWTLGWGLVAAGSWSALPRLAGSPPGRVFLARDAAALVLWIVAVRRPGARLWPGLALLATLSLGSHAVATGDRLAPVLDWVHLVAAAAWAGGLAHLVWLAWRPTPPGSWRTVVRRFSNLAFVSVGLQDRKSVV